MNALLAESIFRAMVILETYPMNERFDSETLSFFQALYRKHRPDKFIRTSKEYRFTRGRVVLFRGYDRALQFRFNNGYLWIASISKLAPRDQIKELRQEVEEYLDNEVYGLGEVA